MIKLEIFQGDFMIKEKLALVPHLPGSYQMKDKDGVIIYVGKAKDLKNRLSSYFHGTHTGKTAKLVSEIVDFEYIVVSSNEEALILEINLIKKYDPKYNILLRDDKSYPYIELTNESVPRLMIVRKINRKRKSGRLFGPYPNVTAAREVVNMLNRIYPLRKCNTYAKKPCLYYHIGECLGYCSLDVSKEKIKEMENEIISFFNGDHTIVTKKLKEEMYRESSLMHYEKAKELKDLLDSINITVAKQTVEINDSRNIDVFGYYTDKGYLSLQVLFIRGCKIIERHKTILPLIDEVSNQLTDYVATFYDKGVIKPSVIIVPNIVDDEVKSYLNINIEKPVKGVKKKILDMACENANVALNEKYELLKRDDERTIGANNELKEILKLDKLNRIEIFDNSNLFGEYNVSGMVVFVNGKPSKKDYRKFKITKDVNDDYGTMKEVIYRRYYRLLIEKSILPDLIIVDGGLGQINVAREVIKSLNLNIMVVGLKKDEHHRTNKLLAFDPIVEVDVKPTSNLFFYLERIQDEVHEFTINYHKQIRSKGLVSSELDNIEGIGKKRRDALLEKFKSLENIKNSNIEELSSVVPKDIAIKIKEHLEKIDFNKK